MTENGMFNPKNKLATNLSISYASLLSWFISWRYWKHFFAVPFLVAAMTAITAMAANAKVAMAVNLYLKTNRGLKMNC
jgi:hypothetical protein